MDKHYIFVVLDEKLNDSCMDSRIRLAIEQYINGFLFFVSSEESKGNIFLDGSQAQIGLDSTAIQILVKYSDLEITF